MITVHHLNDSRSQRILWLLEELGVPYRIERYRRGPDMMAPASLKAVHPLGKSPTISDGTVVVAESGAIVEYLVDRYGATLRPAPDSPERLRYTYWMHYAEGSLMPVLLVKLIFDQLETGPVPFFLRPVAKAISGKVGALYTNPQIKLHLDYLEAELGKSAWFAGPTFTAADVQMSFPLEAAAERGGLDRSRPRLWAFLERIRARPAYQAALAKGGPYKFAGEAS